MRIFSLEINWSPRNTDDNRVWDTPPVNPKRLGEMTPTELRFELARIHQHLVKDNPSGANSVRGSHRNGYQRIHFDRSTFR